MALIIIPARQMSEGVPCKNRTHWPALMETVKALNMPAVVVTDDPWIASLCDVSMWLTMGPQHTVSTAVAWVLGSGVVIPFDPDDGITAAVDQEVVVVLQPSSPTRNRAEYVKAAISHLQLEPWASAVVSVVPWAGEPPSKACTVSENGMLVIPSSPEPRQLQPRFYRRDGTVYCVRVEYAKQGDLCGPRPIPLLIDPADSVTID